MGSILRIFNRTKSKAPNITKGETLKQTTVSNKCQARQGGGNLLAIMGIGIVAIFVTIWFFGRSLIEYNFGILEHRLKEQQAHIEQVKKAVTKNPQNVTCQTNSGWVVLDESWVVKGDYFLEDNVAIPLGDCQIIE